MKKPHICLIDYDMSDWGGVEQVIENLSHAFLADYQVSIISLCTGFIKTYDGISCYTIIHKRARMREIIAKGYFKLIKTINQNHVDIIMVCESCAGMVVSLARPWIKGKVIYADHSTLRGTWDDKPIRYMQYINSKISDYTVTLTEQNQKDYIKYFHHPKNKICHIYNWINENIFSSAKTYNNNTKKIITVGRLTEVKGYDRLLDIAEIVLPKNPEWEWHIYGEGKLEKMLNQEIQHRHLENQLILKGASKKMWEEYQNYSIFALTSYLEGLSLVLLEAKANRLPTISFNILIGPAEIINDGINGFLITDGQISDFAQKLESLMHNDDLRYSFSAHAYEGIEKFQKDTILNQWKNLFSQLLS